MKKYTFIASLFFGTLAAQAQISITQADLYSAGDKADLYTDTTGLGGPGASGSNVSWDFSAAQEHYSSQQKIVTAASTGMSATFPGADLALTEDDTTFIFFSVDAFAHNVYGFGTTMSGVDPMVLSPARTELSLPLQSGDQFGSSYRSEVSIDGSQLGVYRIIVVQHINLQKSVDAWGSISTPAGTYDALRIFETQISEDSVFIQLTAGTPPMFSGDVSMDTVRKYQWLAEDHGFPVAEFEPIPGMPQGGHFRWFVPEEGTSTGVPQHTQNELLLWPNPVSTGNTLYISGAGSGAKRLRIVNAGGQQVQARDMDGETLQLSTGHMKPGLYHYIIENKTDAASHSGSFIVQ